MLLAIGVVFYPFVAVAVFTLPFTAICGSHYTTLHCHLWLTLHYPSLPFVAHITLPFTAICGSHYTTLHCHLWLTLHYPSLPFVAHKWQ